MIAKDLSDDLKVVLSNCSESLIFRRLTDAITMLANNGDGNWDGLVGQMTIAVDGFSGHVTFPRDVLTPLQFNLDGCPTFPRDKYFKYHTNGPGSRWLDASSVAWDDVGQFPVFREASEDTAIIVESLNAADDGKEMTVWYFDSEDRESSQTFTLSSSAAQTSSFTLKRISRVAKDNTVGDVKISYVLPEVTLAGQYAGDETDPQYRRVRLRATNSIELIYRRRTRDITSWESYIPLENRLAVIQAVRSVYYRYNMDIERALQYEADAVRLLQQEQYVRNINNSPIGPQVLDYSSESNDRLFHGGYW